MDGQFLSMFPGLTSNGGVADVRHLFDDIQLTKPVASIFLGDCAQASLVFLPHILEMPKPIIAQSKPITPESGPHAAAPVMPAHDDVADLQNLHGKLHDGQTIEIRVHHQIGDVAMDK